MKKMKKALGYLLYVLVGGNLPHGKNSQFPVSQAIRRLSGRLLFDRMGKNTNIGRKVRFSTHVSLGDNSGIGDWSYFSGEVEIGNDVMIAPRCSFIALDHKFDEEDPLIHLGSEEKKIIIEDHVWLGYGVTILAGVTVGRGSIVAAGAVVTKDVEAFSVVGGVPARLIKKRCK